MIELVFVACLAITPVECDERKLIYSGITPLVCMMGAQAQLAEWTTRNPGYRISGWKCRWRRADVDRT